MPSAAQPHASPWVSYILHEKPQAPVGMFMIATFCPEHSAVLCVSSRYVGAWLQAALCSGRSRRGSTGRWSESTGRWNRKDITSKELLSSKRACEVFPHITDNGKLLIRVGGGYTNAEKFVQQYGHMEVKKSVSPKSSHGISAAISQDFKKVSLRNSFTYDDKDKNSFYKYQPRKTAKFARNRSDSR